MTLARTLAVFSVVTAAACGGFNLRDGGSRDSGATRNDAGIVDAGSVDASVPDSGSVPDAGAPPDGGKPDAGNPGDGGTPGNYPDAGPCAGLDGVHCGATLKLDPGTLYQCTGGTVSIAQHCSGVCVVHTGATADTCPCPNGDGNYCGGDVGLDAKKTFVCTKGIYTPQQACAAACSAGTCAACPFGDGLYCGQAVQRDSTTLFQCTAGVLTVQQLCGGPCHQMPNGQNDTCGGCAQGNGLYCGQALGLNGNTLYNCQNGVVTVQQQCGSACQQMPAGTNDTCGNCPQGNGLYCGQALSLDGNTLYTCNNGVVAVSQQCNGACRQMPAGQNDQCPSTCDSYGQAAIAWQAAQLAAGNSWSDLCLGFASHAYSDGAGVAVAEMQQYSAVDSLHAFQNAGKLHAWDGSAPPCGALILWDINRCNGYYGHIGISNGDGTMTTAGWPGFGGSTHVTIGWMSGMECSNAPAGWAAGP